MATSHLGEEHRRRVRAFTLSALGALALLAVGVLTYALVVGFGVPGTGTVDAAARGGHERDLVVRAVIGRPGCTELTGTEVTERDAEVALTVRTSIPHGTRWDFQCPDDATFVYHTVRLQAPLEERSVLDETTGAPVQVHDSVAALVGREG